MQDDIIDLLSEQAVFLRTSQMQADSEGGIWIQDPVYGWVDDEDWGTLQDWVETVLSSVWEDLDPNEQKRGLEWNLSDRIPEVIEQREG